jgi:hypothetical protein
VGEAVSLAPGAPPQDTRHWLDALASTRGHSERDHDGVEKRPFVYLEPGASGAALRRLALVLPPARPYSTNGLVTTHWGEKLSAFDFGVDAAHTFGSVSVSGDPASTTRALRSHFVSTGVNVQDAELLYDVERTPVSLLERKGLVPGVPVSFERFALFDRGAVRDDQEPTQHPESVRSLTVAVGMRPSAAGAWRSLETLELLGYRVIYAVDGAEQGYFLAAPLPMQPTCFFGRLGTDLVVPSATGEAPERAADEEAAALIFTRASAATLLLGKVKSKDEILANLDRASRYLQGFDAAFESFRRGDRAPLLHDYARSLVESHASKRDIRALTELPYGDWSYPRDVDQASADVGFGTDEASVLRGLVSYFRATRDHAVLGAIEALADASGEALTPSGSVWLKRFDEMLVAAETDPRTGRADAFLDNGGVSVAFNHQNLIVGRGQERTPGVTWGTPAANVDGKTTAADDGSYRFSIDGESIPQESATDKEALEVSRLFSRVDGKIRFRETAHLSRGLPFARIDTGIENTGHDAERVDQALLTVGDFFHYGNDLNEVAQNRYGFSRVFEGVPLHVGFWMEGMPEPLWGDNFPAGWVDVTDRYRRYRPRFVCVFGYDKAELYSFDREPDALALRNVIDDGSTKDGYAGWTTLRVRYDVGRTLDPGTRYEIPSVYTYPLWAPLVSADEDGVPDEVQSIGPEWSEVVSALKDTASEAERDERLRSLADRSKATRLRSLLHTSLESDHAYAAMQSAWMQAVDLFRDLARQERDDGAARDLARRARELREKALAGAEFSLRIFTHLRNRADLYPAYGAGGYYGFQLAVFDWAYRETGDDRYRDAVLRLADSLATSEKRGGLQVTDPERADSGGYVVNELSHAAGTIDLGDQGVKLWALRIAYERTGDRRYRASAELCIDRWVKQRSDGVYFGTTRLFDRFVPIGPEQGRSPRGHYLMMLGLRAWSDLHPRAGALFERGLRYANERHQVHSLGPAGVYEMVFPDEGRVDFATKADLGGIFLWAMTLSPGSLHGRWDVGRAPPRAP